MFSFHHVALFLLSVRSDLSVTQLLSPAPRVQICIQIHFPCNFISQHLNHLKFACQHCSCHRGHRGHVFSNISENFNDPRRSFTSHNYTRVPHVGLFKAESGIWLVWDKSKYEDHICSDVKKTYLNHHVGR